MNTESFVLHTFVIMVMISRASGENFLVLLLN